MQPYVAGFNQDQSQFSRILVPTCTLNPTGNAGSAARRRFPTITPLRWDTAVIARAAAAGPGCAID